MTDFEGFDELAEELRDLGENMDAAALLLDSAVDHAVEKTAAQVERTAKQKAPVDTNTLRTSIGYRQIGQAEYVVGTNVDYADDVEFGTRPHVITPDEAKALRFTDGGEVVFAKRVEHPGTPAQPYLRPALIEHKSDLVENIEDEIENLFQEVFG